MARYAQLYRGPVPAPITTVAVRYRSTAFAVRLDARRVGAYLRMIQGKVADHRLSRESAQHWAITTLRTGRHLNERDGLRLGLIVLWLACSDREAGFDATELAQRGDGTIGCLITGERHSAQFRIVLGPSRLHQFRDIAATDMTPAGCIAA